MKDRGYWSIMRFILSAESDLGYHKWIELCVGLIPFALWGFFERLFHNIDPFVKTNHLSNSIDYIHGKINEIRRITNANTIDNATARNYRNNSKVCNLNTPQEYNWGENAEGINNIVDFLIDDCMNLKNNRYSWGSYQCWS